MFSRLLAAALVLTAGLTVSCRSSSGAEAGPRLVRPGAPGEETRVVTREEGLGEPLRHTEADVRFMQGMIAHHLQAVEMTGLVAERSSRADILLLARRIQASQADELQLMERWLRERGESVPGPHAHHEGEHSRMPGMLSRDQMARLAAASGEEFDRLFLAAMVIHHEGALNMVANLFSVPGAAQETEIFTFASHVEADQRSEIARMHRMLRASS